MIVNQENDIEIEGDMFKNSTKAQINSDNLGFIFQLLTRDIYKDPIGSVVREITSNCFDAHIAAGVEEPIVISVDIDDGGTYISFQDYGTGMSPDLMKNVYMSVGESTKRQSDDFIGAFGIGSKSALSYTESFFIDTIVDGMEYSYIMHRGKDLPELNLISNKKTTKRNGTVIKIYFKEYSDRSKFQEAINVQLRYFDSIIFKSSLGILPSNSFKILQGKTFKYREERTVSSYNKLTTLHICLGKVFYPIDWSEVKYTDNQDNFISEIPIPFALKFEIGELKVTPNRESLKYDDVTINAIKRKIFQFKNEIKDRIERQAKPLTELGERENYYTLFYYDGVPFMCEPQVLKKLGIKVNKSRVLGLPEVGITKSTVDLFLKPFAAIRNGSLSKVRLPTIKEMLTNLSIPIYLVFSDDEKIPQLKAKYLDKANIILFKKPKYESILATIEKESVSVSEGNRRKRTLVYDSDCPNIVGIISKVNEFFKDYVSKFDKLEDVIVPPEFKASLGVRFSNLADDRIYICDGINFTGQSYREFQKYLKNNNPTNLIYYGFREHDEYLKFIKQIYINHDKIKIVRITKKMGGLFEYNTKFIGEFISGDKHFRNVATAFYIKKHLYDIIHHITKNDIFYERRFPNIYIVAEELKDYMNRNSYLNTRGDNAEFLDSVLKLADEKGFYNGRKVQADWLLKVFNRVPIIPFIERLPVNEKEEAKVLDVFLKAGIPYRIELTAARPLKQLEFNFY